MEIERLRADLAARDATISTYERRCADALELCRVSTNMVQALREIEAVLKGETL